MGEATRGGADGGQNRTKSLPLAGGALKIMKNKTQTRLKLYFLLIFFLQYFIVVNLITEKRPAVKFTAADVGS